MKRIFHSTRKCEQEINLKAGKGKLNVFFFFFSFKWRILFFSFSPHLVPVSRESQFVQFHQPIVPPQLFDNGNDDNGAFWSKWLVLQNNCFMPLSGTIWRYLVARYGNHALRIRESRQPMKISKTKKHPGETKERCRNWQCQIRRSGTFIGRIGGIT